MICINCGNEIQPDAAICPFCNSEIKPESNLEISAKISAEISAEINPENNPDGAAAAEEAASSAEPGAFRTPPQTIPPLKAKKGLRFKILAICIPVIILMLAVAAYAAVSSGMFLSPKQYYIMTETKNFLTKTEGMSSSLTDSFNKFEALSKGKSKSYDADISVAIDNEGIPEEGAQLVKFLNALKMHSYSATNSTDLKAVQKLGLTVKDKELLGLNFYLDKTKLYADVPALWDKYFLADLSNIKGIAGNLGVDSASLPDNITEDDVRKAFGLKNNQDTKDEYAAILPKYGKLYFDSIPESCYTLERSSSLELEGRKLKCNKLVIKFSEQQFKDFILAFTDALKNDEELFNLVSKDLQDSGKFMKNNDMVTALNSGTFDKEEFKKTINDFEEAVKNDMKIPDGVSMTIWAQNGDIVKRTIETAIDDGTENIGVLFSTSGIKANDGKYMTKVSLDFVNNTEGRSDDKVTFAYSGASWADSEKSDLYNGEFKLSNNQNGASNTSLILKLDADTKGKDALKNLSARYDLSYSDNTLLDSKFHIKGEFTDNASENSKSKMFSDDITFSMNFTSDGGDQSQQFGGKLNMLIQRAYDIDLKLPEFKADNTVDLATVDQEQLNSLASGAVLSLLQIINDNPWLSEYADFSAFDNMFGGM